MTTIWALEGRPTDCSTSIVPLSANFFNFMMRSLNAVIRVYDVAGNVIETHEHKGDFKEW